MPTTKNPDDRIEINEDVMMGKPVIKNTRITIEQILRKLSQDISTEELLADYPNLSRDDVRAALEYAADSIHGEEVHLIGEEG